MLVQWKYILFAVGAAIALRSLAPLIINNVGFTPVDEEVGRVVIARGPAELIALKGKSALIVGGTKGIGRGIAIQLAAAGAHVSIVGRSGGIEVLELMRAASPEKQMQQFNTYSVDLSDVEGCKELVRQVKDSGRKVDLLVLTLGVWPDPVNPRTAAGVHKTIAIDVFARFTIFRELHLRSVLSAHPVVMSVLASTKVSPPIPISAIKQIVTGARDPTMLEFFVVAPLLDCILAQASVRSEYQDVQFMGTYPGFVNTELIYSSNTAPKWLVKMGFMLLSGLNLVLSEEDTGLRHASLLDAAVSGRIKKRAVYFDHELVGRHGGQLSSDVAFQEWLWSYLTSLSPQ